MRVKEEQSHAFGRDPDGSWRVGSEFDPRDWGDDYTETNAWGTMFTAPHDGAGVVDLHGGPQAFDAAVDRFFAEPETGATDRSGHYGFPIHDHIGLKAANHLGGEPTDPESTDRTTHRGEEADTVENLKALIPA